MANVVCEISVTQRPLTPPESDVAGAGAVVDFWGVVRPIEDKRKIEGIDYETHREMAEHQLKRIAQRATDTFQLQLVIMYHRIGFIAVGEASLFLRVASMHREQAFRASQWIIDELKTKVPIWKKPKFNQNVVAGIGDFSSHGNQSKRSAERPVSAIPAPPK